MAAPSAHLPRDPDAPRVPEALPALERDADRPRHDERYAEATLGWGDAAGTEARGVTIETARGEGVDLTGARMPMLTLLDVALRGGSLANADLRDASIRRTSLDRMRLTGLALTEASLQDVVLRECRVDLAALAGARLRRVAFADCSLAGSALQDLRAEDVAFERCDLREVDLTGARFTRTTMRGCTLDGIRDIERLRGVGMAWSDVLAAAGAFAGAIGVRLLDD